MEENGYLDEETRQRLNQRETESRDAVAVLQNLPPGQIRRVQQAVSRVLNRGPVRPCPGCGVEIERDGGCHHMTCVRMDIIK